MTNEQSPLAPFETRVMRRKVEELHYYLNEISYPAAEMSPDLPVETQYESEDEFEEATQEFLDRYDARATLAFLAEFLGTDILTDLPGRIQVIIQAAKV